MSGTVHLVTLARKSGPSIQRLAELGVARISLGPELLQAAMGWLAREAGRVRAGEMRELAEQTVPRPGGVSPRPERRPLSPADVFPIFAQHVSSGNVDEVMALYEPDATYISGSGEPLRGDQIRESFRRFTALGPEMSGEMEKVIESRGLALVNNRWRFSAKRSDGSPVQGGGISAVVLRRRPDGSWGVLIDDPWGAGRLSLPED